MKQKRIATPDDVIQTHKTKPWLPGFAYVLLRPLRKVKKAYLGRRVAVHLRRGGMEIWRKPTKAFWLAHARASHPKGKEGYRGHGCSVDVHTSYLTKTGKNAEFMYGWVNQEGQFRVEDRESFRRECAWWAKYYS